jgi:hypothetical protein
VSKIYLNVPYTEKEEAKSLGARWDKESKRWHVESCNKNLVKMNEWRIKPPEPQESL